MTRSLYAVLNVAPDADPAVIEAAYKALMKKYHPDATAGAPAADERRAAEINEAFHVLRNAERRSQYDNQERARQDQERARQEAMRRAIVERAYAYSPPPPPPRKRRKWPVLLLIAILTAIVFAVWSESQGDGWRAADAIAATGRQIQHLAEKEPGPPQEADVKRAVAKFVKIRNETGLLGLTSYSQDCFAAQGRSPSASEFDHCVAFDNAAATYDSSMLGGYVPQIPRFDPTEAKLRHVAAARLISSDEDWISARLSKIRELTAQEIAALSAPPQQATSVPIATTAGPARQWHARRLPVRPAARRQSRVPRTAAERDFLERQGYIY